MSSIPPAAANNTHQSDDVFLQQVQQIYWCYWLRPSKTVISAALWVLRHGKDFTSYIIRCSSFKQQIYVWPPFLPIQPEICQTNGLSGAHVNGAPLRVRHSADVDAPSKPHRPHHTHYIQQTKTLQCPPQKNVAFYSAKFINSCIFHDASKYNTVYMLCVMLWYMWWDNNEFINLK